MSVSRFTIREADFVITKKTFTISKDGKCLTGTLTQTGFVATQLEQIVERWGQLKLVVRKPTALDLTDWVFETAYLAAFTDICPAEMALQA